MPTNASNMAGLQKRGSRGSIGEVGIADTKAEERGSDDDEEQVHEDS
jgi:hypothetical protein